MKAVKNKQKKGIDPFVPQKGDSETIGNWRKRMGTEAAKAIYKLRSSIAEFPNAVFRNCVVWEGRVAAVPGARIGQNEIGDALACAVVRSEADRVLRLGRLFGGCAMRRK